MLAGIGTAQTNAHTTLRRVSQLLLIKRRTLVAWQRISIEKKKAAGPIFQISLASPSSGAGQAQLAHSLSVQTQSDRGGFSSPAAALTAKRTSSTF
jgi:hypothetical protein